VNTAKIAELNDQFRRHGIGSGRTMVTRNVADLGPDFQLAALLKVRAFDAFTPDNNPHGERDYGSFELHGRKLFWKFDYYDRSLQYGSEDPSDPLQTCRVLTIGFMEDY